MTGKDVWKWLLSRFDDDIILTIYQKKKVICKGFRTNNIQDIKTNRNHLLTNLLNKDNYPKLLSWSKDVPPSGLEEISFMNKELNELVDIAGEKGVPAVLTKLFYENQEKKAVQLFAFLQDENSNLLDVPNHSISGIESSASPFNTKEKIEDTESKTNKELEAPHPDGKKIQKLAQKVENLTGELEKRNAIHKAKLGEVEKNSQQILQKLNDKNQLYGNLVKEKEVLTKEYEEEKKKWNIERDHYKETIALLEREVRQLQERIKEELDESIDVDFIDKSHQTQKLQIIVIGTPANTTHFQSDTIEFTFIEGNDVHNYTFPMEFDAYWILLYELSNRDQLLLNLNESYSQLNKNKITICKNFIDVKKQIKQYTRVEERVI